MAFGSKDGIVAYNMKKEDTREYELAKAPLKRLLLQGIRNAGSPFRKPKVSEGLVLVFRQQVEDYALELAERIGSVSAVEHRVTSKIIDLKMANNGFYIPHPTLPEPETAKKEETPKQEWKAGFYEGITIRESIKICDRFIKKAVDVITQAQSEMQRGKVSVNTIKELKKLESEAHDIGDMLRGEPLMHEYSNEIAEYYRAARDFRIYHGGES